MVTFLTFGILVWLILVSLFLVRIWFHYNHLVMRTDKRRLSQILDNFVKDSDHLKMSLKVITKHLEEIDAERTKYFQKMAIVRFNPFKGIGGNQSFVLALLNEKKSGLMVNFIYTKDGLRVYAKEVKAGRGVSYQLSSEEEKAIKKVS